MRNVLTLWHMRASNERHYLYMLDYAHDRREAKQLAQPFFNAHPTFPEHRLKPLPYGFPSLTLWWMPGQMTEDGRDVTPWVPAFERLDPTIFEGCVHEEASVRLTLLNQAQFALFSREDWGMSKLIERRAARMVMRQLAWFKRRNGRAITDPIGIRSMGLFPYSNSHGECASTPDGLFHLTDATWEHLHACWQKTHCVEVQLD
ncbi:hypothetical protein KSC_017200 [Ktedonobacter sp. SOSP1-52]|uniref:hypothetical protein n=1 Tax=Ktedonobacter sp. SOSP1-52 TaxID=2778366 RepID=UPI0019169610|nr:hypothetical protein [Ktedonobacter sp. SOSP1-52]GHO62828.1 hypothetical protein KSC_017200 [Ktedonobacter sp. SOSP1-52]